MPETKRIIKILNVTYFLISISIILFNFRLILKNFDNVYSAYAVLKIPKIQIFFTRYVVIETLMKSEYQGVFVYK